MKKCLSTLIFLFCLRVFTSDHAYGQQNLSLQVSKQLSIERVTEYNLFSLSGDRSEEIDKVIRDVTYLKLDRSQLARLTNEDKNLVSFSIPTDDNSEITIQLMRYDFRSEDYRTVAQTKAGAIEVAKPDGDFYRGALSGKDRSMAAFSFYDDEMVAVFSDQRNGNYNLVPNKENPGVHQENYILYREDAIIDKSGRSGCAMTDDIASISGPTSGNGDLARVSNIYATGCKLIRVSVFTDYLMYQKYITGTVKTIQYVNTLFNVISALYANDGIQLSLSEIVVSTSDQGYDYTNSKTLLADFGNLIQKYQYNGDLAHCITGYINDKGKASLGGRAWLDVLCHPARTTEYNGNTTYYGPYGISNANTKLNSFPIYSRDVSVVAHELGHNIGSPHTQSCSWPGGPIDGCVAPEGGCTIAGPLPANGGTIMSYCEVRPDIGVNFANGFGRLPTELLHRSIINAGCLRSGLPDGTLNLASKSIIANTECNDGIWTHYFFDNNTSNPNDDIRLLSVKKDTSDIGNVHDTRFLIKMTTNGFFGQGTVPGRNAPYADTNWYEINRKWTIQLPTGKQPVTPITVRYPYLQQDVADISEALLPASIKDPNLIFLKYANYTPVMSFPSSSAADVRKLANSNTAGSAQYWYSGSENNYKYAEIVADSGIYGGTLGYQLPEGTVVHKLSIYPNPATAIICIDRQATDMGPQQIIIFDKLSRVVYRQQMEFLNDRITIDISGFGSGFYTLKCLGTQSSLNGIFIKQ